MAVVVSTGGCAVELCLLGKHLQLPSSRTFACRFSTCQVIMYFDGIPSSGSCKSEGIARRHDTLKWDELNNIALILIHF